MPVAQLSLWDNEALERGYRSLSGLELNEAVKDFNTALQSGLGNEAIIREAIGACQFWQPRIMKTGRIIASEITGFIADWQQYPFTRLMTGLKKSLLRYIADCLVQQTVPNWTEIEIVFDSLLALKEYPKAKDFISRLINQNPEKQYLLYFLAQAQWLDGSTSMANDHYILALCQYPDKAYTARVENKKIQSLIQSYGPAIAPAYCLLLGVVPAVPQVHHIAFRDEEHAKAIQSLHLLLQAIKASVSNDRASVIHTRKQLKAGNPELYNVYFNMLNQR